VLIEQYTIVLFSQNGTL